MTEAEAKAMAGHLGLEPAEFRRLYVRRLWRGPSLKEKANYDCILLDSRGECAVYPVRPTQCRIWPFWPSNLRSPSAWDAARERCPGIGRGRLWTLEEIEARQREMKA
jgi:hypothetical protein